MNGDYRGYAGKIESGRVRPGDELAVLPRGTHAVVEAIDTPDGPLDLAVAGQSVVIRLNAEVDVSRGDILAATDAPPAPIRELTATVCWLAERELTAGARVLVQHGTSITRAAVRSIEGVLDLSFEAGTVPCWSTGRCTHPERHRADPTGSCRRRFRSIPTASIAPPGRSSSSTMRTAGPSERRWPARPRSPPGSAHDRTPQRRHHPPRRHAHRRQHHHNTARGHRDRSFPDPARPRQQRPQVRPGQPRIREGLLAIRPELDIHVAFVDRGSDASGPLGSGSLRPPNPLQVVNKLAKRRVEEVVFLPLLLSSAFHGPAGMMASSARFEDDPPGLRSRRLPAGRSGGAVARRSSTVGFARRCARPGSASWTGWSSPRPAAGRPQQCARSLAVPGSGRRTTSCPA